MSRLGPGAPGTSWCPPGWRTASTSSISARPARSWRGGYDDYASCAPARYLPGWAAGDQTPGDHRRAWDARRGVPAVDPGHGGGGDGHGGHDLFHLLRPRDHQEGPRRPPASPARRQPGDAGAYSQYRRHAARHDPDGDDDDE